MYFFVASIIIAVACSVITIRTLVGYTSMKFKYKLACSLLILAGWFAPALVGILRRSGLNGWLYSFLADTGYFLFGAVFLLFCLLLLRDILWFLLYALYKRYRGENWAIHPKNINILDKANFFTVVLAAFLSFYALLEGTKLPEIKYLNLSSAKISKDLTIAHVSDLHINRATSVGKVRKIVDMINGLNPDVIALTGDVIDDRVEAVLPQMEELKNLKARYAVFVSFGNHEFYNGLLPWQFKFKQMGFYIMFNRGIKFPDSNVFIAGIPDSHTARLSDVWVVDFVKALKGSRQEDYRILLSHTPDFVDYLTSDAIDLQLSGHTHGGQIFPFHLPVKYANRYLAGLYDVNGIQLYVSRGAGFWGPPMRLFAPSDITLITVKAKDEEEPAY